MSKHAEMRRKLNKEGERKKSGEQVGKKYSDLRKNNTGKQRVFGKVSDGCMHVGFREMKAAVYKGVVAFSYTLLLLLLFSSNTRPQNNNNTELRSSMTHDDTRAGPERRPGLFLLRVRVNRCMQCV